MKFSKIAILTLFSGALTFCSGPKPGSGDQVSDTSADKAVPVEKSAVCVWDQISVRKEPSSKSKWLTSLSLGETLTSLGTTALDSADKNRAYVLVRLADGTEGWSIADFIISDAKVAVFLGENSIYKRPDLLTKTDDQFGQMDIVAIKAVEGDWMEVVGKREGAKWIQSGWVKQGNLSESDIDVAVAKFAKSALAKTSDEEKVIAIQEIVDNTDFASSAFISVLKNKLDDLETDFTDSEDVVDTLNAE